MCMFVCIYVCMYVCISNRPVLSLSTRNNGAIIYTALNVLKAFKHIFPNLLIVSNQ